MGRQHTTWISDETWDQLQRIGGDSISDKLRNAVRYCDPQQMQLNIAAQARLDVAMEALRAIRKAADGDYLTKMYQDVDEILNEVWYTVMGLTE